MLKKQSEVSTRCDQVKQKNIELGTLLNYQETLEINQVSDKNQIDKPKDQLNNERQISSENLKFEQDQNDLLAMKKSTIRLKDKIKLIESIRLSYQVLGNFQEVSPEKRKRNNFHKKSFEVFTKEQDFSEAKNQKLQQIRIKDNLKSPLNIDLKKLNSNNIKLYQLSEHVQYFNEKVWLKCVIDIDPKSQQLLVSNLHIPFSTVQKIKIYKPNVQKNENEIKISYKNLNVQQSVYLNVEGQKQIKRISSQYLIFEQILTNKLRFQNRLKETKWQKKHHICEQIIFASYIFGDIYKKSQHFGRWQKRYIVINNKGIFSYKSGSKKQDYSFHIQKESIEYMWSRFDIVDGNLVIKIKHGIKQTQFGIPITNFSSPHYKNWLYYFYRLMMKNN